MSIFIRTFLAICISAATTTKVYSQSEAAKKTYSDAYEAYKKNDNETAIRKFTEAIQLYPDYGDAYKYRGLTYLKKESYTEALADFNEVVRIDPQGATGYHDRGFTRYLSKDYENAITDFTRSISLTSNPELPYVHRGKAYSALKKYDSAIADFTKVIETLPRKDRAYIGRGNTFFSKEQYEQAVLDYSEVIRSDPANTEAYNLRGVAYKWMGRYDMAINDLDAAIRINPDYWVAYTNIFSPLVRTLQFNKAKEYYSKYLERNLAEKGNKEENRVYTYYIRAATEDIPSNNYEQALSKLNAAANEYGDESKKLSQSRYTNILALKGYVLEKMLRLNEAQATLEQALSINARQPDVEKQIAAVKLLLTEMSLKDKTAPEIQLLSPQTSQGIELNAAKTQIIGRAKDASGISAVTINGTAIDKVEEDGLFIAEQIIKPGVNEVIITATDKQGNMASKTFTLTGVVAKNNNVDGLGIPVIGNSTPKYYAILIAENNYLDASIPSLKNPVKDARELRSILTKNYTFNVSDIDTLFDQSREEIMQTITQRCNTLTENDNLLVFYAGHGTAEKDKYGDVDGYWIPVSAKKNVSSSYISSDDINKALKRSNAKHILLIADACFSGAFTRSLPRDAGKLMQKLYQMPSRKIMASGNLEPVPDNSKFLFYLKKSLTDNTAKYLSAKDLFDSFYKSIINNTDNLPQYAAIKNVGDEGGEFVFIKR